MQPGTIDTTKILLTVERVADVLDVTRQAVLHNIKTGRIKAHKQGRLWMIPLSEIDEWETKVGRPRKKV